METWSPLYHSCEEYSYQCIHMYVYVYVYNVDLTKTTSSMDVLEQKQNSFEIWWNPAESFAFWGSFRTVASKLSISECLWRGISGVWDRGVKQGWCQEWVEAAKCMKVGSLVLERQVVSVSMQHRKTQPYPKWLQCLMCNCALYFYFLNHWKTLQVCLHPRNDNQIQSSQYFEGCELHNLVRARCAVASIFWPWN